MITRATRMLLQHGRNALRHRRATTAVEFALIAPILALCLTSVYDLGNALQQNIRMREAVRAGGLYAQFYAEDTTGIQNAVTGAVSNWTNVTVNSVTRSCECWNSSTVTFTSTIACADTSACTSGNAKQGFVTVQASRPFSAMFLPGITTTSVSHVTRYQ